MTDIHIPFPSQSDPPKPIIQHHENNFSTHSHTPTLDNITPPPPLLLKDLRHAPGHRVIIVQVRNFTLRVRQLAGFLPIVRVVLRREPEQLDEEDRTLIVVRV